MKQDFIDPPSMSISLESFSGNMKHAGKLAKQLMQSEKQNILTTLEIGRALLRARPMAAVGEWEPALQEQGISSQRASEAMRGASAPLDEQEKWESIRAMAAWLNEQSGQGKKRIPGAGDTNQNGQENSRTTQRGSTPPATSNDMREGRALESALDESGTSPGGHTGQSEDKLSAELNNPPKKGRPKGPSKPCERCLRIGVPSCDACKAAFPKGFPEREAGDDAKEEEAAAKQDAQDKKDNGKPVFDDRKVTDAIGKIARLFNDRAEAFHQQKSREWKEVRDKMNALLEAWEAWHKKGARA